MKRLDRQTIEGHGLPSLVLMERAALAAVDVLLTEGFGLERVSVVCGPGNNGGDGIAVARLLHLAGYKVDLVFVGDPDKRSEETRKQGEIAESYGLRIGTFAAVADAANAAAVADAAGKADAMGAAGATNVAGAVAKAGASENPTTVVDAIFGIGGVRAPEGDFADAIRYINTSRAAGAKVLAIDVPSGVSADTGDTPGEAVSADVTVTFAYKKVGLTKAPGSALAGKIIVKDIGIYFE